MGTQMTSVETQVTSLRMNEAASEMADGMADRAEVFRTHSYRLPSGARVIDAGVEVDGESRQAWPSQRWHGRMLGHVMTHETGPR